MKRAIILQHGPSSGIHGQLANQLWNYVSIYAYGVERGIPVRNYSFFEYQRFFRMPVDNAVVDLLFFKPFSFLARFVPGRVLVPLWRRLYKLFVLATEVIAQGSVIRSGNAGYDDPTYHLPPSDTRAELLEKEASVSGNLYFDGWLFRNPEGLAKHRDAIREHFKPKDEVIERIDAFIEPLRTKYDRLIGVHIRQGDYVTWKGGRYFVSQERIRQIIDEYIVFANVDAERTCFVLTSDGPIEPERFDGLKIAVASGTAVEDLFMLAQTDAILGSDSSYSDFAAYYGDVPHIVVENESMDWEYYRGKDRFFENKYCTLVHY